MKKLFNKIHLFLIQVFGSAERLEQYVLDHADDAIAFCQQLKSFIDSPIVDVVELATPDNVDRIIELLRNKSREAILKVIETIGIGTDCLEKPTFEEKFLCFILAARKFSPVMQNGILLKTGSVYIQQTSDVHVKESIADTAIQTKIAERKIDTGAWATPA